MSTSGYMFTTGQYAAVGGTDVCMSVLTDQSPISRKEGRKEPMLVHQSTIMLPGSHALVP